MTSLLACLPRFSLLLLSPLPYIVPQIRVDKFPEASIPQSQPQIGDSLTLTRQCALTAPDRGSPL
eukprot:31106-Hanusia_phi.AAC.1